MSDYIIAKKSNIINIANVIREKTELTQGLLLNNFSTLTQNIRRAAPTDILEMVGADEYQVISYTGKNFTNVPNGLILYKEG